MLGLEQAVRVMVKVQLGRELPDYQMRDILAFLGSLSGEPPPWFSPED